MSDTKERVTKILVDHLCVEPEDVTDEAKLVEDLGADSLDIVELEMAFEDEFSISGPGDDAYLDMTHTVADVVRVIDERCS